MADIFKQIGDNDLLKILLVVAGIYFFISYTKKETLENVNTYEDYPMTLADNYAPASLTLEPVDDEPKSNPAELAQPITEDNVAKVDKKIVDDIVKGKPQLESKDLLPKYDDANAFAKENPVSKLLKEQNFLISGYHVGINTVVQSNKIPYHDLRSAPPIPKQNVGPWSQSSYETPMGSMRKQLEIQ
ncbi:hypothetical protein EBZ38_05300 [bacterium]|nr:hypothetical protein [bacterium]